MCAKGKKKKKSRGGRSGDSKGGKKKQHRLDVQKRGPTFKKRRESPSWFDDFGQKGGKPATVNPKCKKKGKKEKKSLPAEEQGRSEEREGESFSNRENGERHPISPRG